MLLRPYDAAYRLHQRMEAPLLNWRAAKCYQPLQDIESKQLLFDVLANCDEAGQEGIDFHHHFERAMGSLIYSLAYGYRLQTGHEQEFEDAKKVQHEFARTGVVGAYIVDSFPFLNRLPAFLAPWKREGEQLFRLESNLHVGNLEKGLRNPGWNFTKHYATNCPEAQGMPRVEVAFDLGIVSDAALDTSTVALDWFAVAWLTCGDRGWVSKAQALLDDVVGRRLPQFEDRDRLAYIDAIGMWGQHCLKPRPPSRSGSQRLTINGICSQRNPTLEAYRRWWRAPCHQSGGCVYGLQDSRRLHRHG